MCGGAGPNASTLELLVSYYFSMDELEACTSAKPAEVGGLSSSSAAEASDAPVPSVPAAAAAVAPAPPVEPPAVVAAAVSVPSVPAAAVVAPAPPVEPPAVVAAAVPVAASPTGTAKPAAATEGSPKSSFWARIQAKSATQAEESVAGSTSIVANAAAAASTAAPAKSGFWARVQATKAERVSSSTTVQTAFTAPDGTAFQSKHAYRQYMFKNFYSFQNKVNERLVKVPGSVKGKQFGMSDLKGCTALLCDHSDAVQVDRCSESTIFIAASSDSVFLRNCTSCTFIVACKQLRTRDLTNCTVFLYAKTDPVIEATTGLKLGEFNASCVGLTAAFAAAALQPDNNHWKRVFDFHKGDSTYAMPHWSFLPEDQWNPYEIDLSEYGVTGAAECPVQRGSDADPATVSEKNGVSQVAGSDTMQSFGIHTTAAAATG